MAETTMSAEWNNLIQAVREAGFTVEVGSSLVTFGENTATDEHPYDGRWSFFGFDEYENAKTWLASTMAERM